MLCGIHQFQTAGGILHANITIVIYLGLSLATLFGRDHDHTGGCAVTIDGCRRGIFQYVYGGDVIGGDQVDIGSGYTVDHEEGSSGTIDGGGTAEDDGSAAVGIAVGRDVQAGDLTLEQLTDVGDRTAVHVARADGTNGTGQRFSRALSITDHNYIRQLCGGGLQTQADHIAGTNGAGGFCERDVGKYQYISLTGFDAIGTVITAHGRLLRILVEDGYTGQRLSAVVRHLAGDFLLGRLREPKARH